jgi:hypothetical protein
MRHHSPLGTIAIRGLRVDGDTRKARVGENDTDSGRQKVTNTPRPTCSVIPPLDVPAGRDCMKSVTLRYMTPSSDI